MFNVEIFWNFYIGVQKNIFFFWSDFARNLFQELWFSSYLIGPLTLCGAYIPMFEFSNVKTEKRYRPKSRELLDLQVAFIALVKRYQFILFIKR